MSRTAKPARTKRTTASGNGKNSTRVRVPETENRPSGAEREAGPIERIFVRGARQHNLRSVDVTIPHASLTVITGLSGSGKSSLAFDTIYAEGQRRYVESLSPYARQFLGMMERPDVDLVEGLAPAISIEQKTVGGNPRSTVGTVTEVYDYLRLLYARVGVQHCINCGTPVVQQTVDQIIDGVIERFNGRKAMLLAPVVRRRKGHYGELFERALRDGFTRVRVDGEVQEVVHGMKVDRYKLHDIEIVVDRVAVAPEARARLSDSVALALRHGGGGMIVAPIEGDLEEALYSEKLACPTCGTSYDTPEPNSFSFNSPYGACPDCDGLGERYDFDLDLILPDRSLSLAQEGLRPLGKPRRTWQWAQVLAIAERFGYDEDTPLNLWSEEAIKMLLHGSGREKLDIVYTATSGRTAHYRHKIAGVIADLRNSVTNSSSASIRESAQAYMRSTVCPGCNGGRLKKESLAVLIDGVPINVVTQQSLGDALLLLRSLKLTERQQRIATSVMKEIADRLGFLLDVGLHYLTLNRAARSLSGGESQRIRLATQIGSQLSGVLYVLDEPSIGLHQADNTRLIASLHRLRDIGNTVVVVEHDRETIEAADYVIDLGPGAGEHGGEVVAATTPRVLEGKEHEPFSATVSLEGLPSFVDRERSLTARYLSGEREMEMPESRRAGNGGAIVLRGARGHNLHDLTLNLPLGKLVCVTGMSGSGKSSLITQTLWPILSQHFFSSIASPLPYDEIEGLEQIDKVIDIDQSPIGRTPRSNPATYTGLFTLIRDLFTQLPEAKIRGYAAGRFSFNVAGGRCEECQGDGVKKIEMNFLPDVYVPCDVCNGRRYNRETLEVRYRERSIADVLEMTVEEALLFFIDIPKIKRKLQTLHDVGLGYIRLGQQATTLSGGEAQRVKLATELAKVSTGRTLYLLDEPTTGLHFEDVRMLLGVLHSLVEKGNTVVVIEHSLDVIKSADWIIDLGPEGGVRGGRIVAEGTPEEVAANVESVTGRYLVAELARTETKPAMSDEKKVKKRAVRKKTSLAVADGTNSE